MALKALWDLGNVVVRWDPEQIYRMLKLPDEKIETLKTTLFGSIWLELDRGTTDEASVATWIATNTDLSIDDVYHCLDVVRESLIDLPQTLALIRQMKESSIPMYVLSNMSSENARYLRQRDYFELFDGVVISAEEKLLKPETELYQIVLDRYDLQAADLVFVDDTLPNIKAAESIGMHAVHFDGSDDSYGKIRSYFNL